MFFSGHSTINKNTRKQNYPKTLKNVRLLKVPDRDKFVSGLSHCNIYLAFRWLLATHPRLVAKFSKMAAGGLHNSVFLLMVSGQIESAKVSRGSKTSFEKNCFSAWASTLNMGLINKVDMVCWSPVGYGV